MNTFSEYALAYLNLGWSVIPIKDKRPLLSSWTEFQKRRATTDEVAVWQTRWPSASVAIVTGKVSQLVVIDVDGDEGLKAIKPYLNGTDTLMCTTPRGGCHFYFKYPGSAVPCAVGVLPLVDVRGDGGYVVAPAGDIGRNWKNVKTPLAPLPQTLKDILRDSGGGHRRLESQDWAVNIVEGVRDYELTRRVGKLLQVGMAPGEVLTTMRAINLAHCKPPLGDAQLQKIVTSIASRESTKAAQQIKAKVFGATTQKEMLERHSEDEECWIIKEWLPEASCGLIVAPPGNFKTWLLMALAYAVGTGKDFLGHYPVNNRGPVLVVQQEDPFWMLQNRLARMFNQEAPGYKEGYHELDCRFVKEFVEAPIYWHEEREFSLEDKQCMESFERKVAELKPRLVLIDPLYSAVSAKDYMVLGAQSMLVLKRLRDKYRTSFVIAHHTTVAGAGSEDRSTIWGSQFLNAWLEWGWRMPKADDKGNILVRHFKSAAPAPRILLQFRITEWAFNVDIDDKVGASASERIEEMILSGGRYASERDLATAANISPGMAHKAAKKMGLVKDRDGCYRVPE